VKFLALAWALAALLLSIPYAGAAAKAALALNPLALFAAIVIFSAWALRHLGLLAALFVVAALSLQEPLIEGFFPGSGDRHGLPGVAVLGLVLGALAMVRGVRAGVLFSALCGAFGMWLSAPSLVPAIAATTLAGAFVSAWHPGDARAWRLWGAVGAGASLALYLAEQFPPDSGLRLAANHPLHAVAWLAGGEIVARLAEDVRRSPLQMAWPWLALLALPVTIALGGIRITLAEASAAMEIRAGVMDAITVAAAIATLAAMRPRSPAMLLFTTFVAAALLALAWWRPVWQVEASAAQACLALALVDTWTAGRAPARRWLVAGAVVAVLFLPGAIVLYGGALHAFASK
jgi:hypothetical protein